MNQSRERFLKEVYANTNQLAKGQDYYTKYSEPKVNIFEWITEHLQLSAKQIVLDLGCGNGGFHKAVIDSGANVIGIDQSLDMVSSVIKKNPNFVSGVRCWGQALPFKDSIFDAAMCNFMLHHVDRADQLIILREIKRTLKGGCRFVIAASAPENLERLREIHHRAAESCGYKARTGGFLNFTLANLDLVKQVFPRAKSIKFDGWMRFPSVETAIGFYGNLMVDLIEDRPNDCSHRKPLLENVAEQLDKIVSLEGVFLDSRPLGCILSVA